MVLVVVLDDDGDADGVEERGREMRR